MNRFYCSISDVRGEKIIICDPGQVHHIKDVLRFEAGEKAMIFDNLGNVYAARLVNISEKQAEFRVVEKKLKADFKKVMIAVACAIPKKDKIDDIIDKLTQLGVDRIIPLISERVIVKMDKAKQAQRWKRWEKIALSASKQSQRNSVPIVEPVTDFAELIGRVGEFDLKLIPNLLGERKTLKGCLSGKKPESVLVLIGPEGDFTSEEINFAVKAGFIPVTFGDFVFRVETAAVYIASILQYELNT
ncbi:MAG: RsmE family RNA methyltransferase [Candidatus Omnitrophota bacterium]